MSKVIEALSCAILSWFSSFHRYTWRGEKVIGIGFSLGEEEESILFEGRAKLFRLVGQEWKERGVGPVKLLKRMDVSGKCRILMRRDQVHKVCLNHGLHAHLTLAPMGDKGNGRFTAVRLRLGSL